ncbi:hypothetical protein CG478_013535 [Bacillus cytotoxicus]|nr:hypothetical protein CG483_013535 [Bacillus cytotoxicus]AWC41374.1 hypothetical protein CG480_013535 [Bacillus cytotoxicus]AWC49305.1 hypothetical protein CG478_013535 [Bacillus cytotoxicus]AWC53320.1 hypothetical protein CG477_013495 [Bacillus cytotoxicus]AWC57447.1 hypothetical protein CG476_013520 [Bacillus cytotoxicus]
MDLVEKYKVSVNTVKSWKTKYKWDKKEITMTEIAHLIENMYRHHYTPQTISNMTKSVSKQVKTFHQRPLPTRYICV